MSIDHTLAIRVLQQRAEGAMRAVRDVDKQIGAMQRQRDQNLRDARALQAAADSLLADMEADAPGVDYSPADGEQPRRKHKYAVGDRVLSTNGGSFLKGEVGIVEVLQPDAERPHPSTALWYEVRFPENERGIRPLLTMSEGTLAPAPEEEQAAPGIKLLPGERLQFDIPAAEAAGTDSVVTGESYVVNNPLRPGLHGKVVTAIQYSKTTNQWHVRVNQSRGDAYVPAIHLLKPPATPENPLV